MKFSKSNTKIDWAKWAWLGILASLVLLLLVLSYLGYLPEGSLSPLDRYPTFFS